jgi:hypothetical protein
MMTGMTLSCFPPLLFWVFFSTLRPHMVPPMRQCQHVSSTPIRRTRAEGDNAKEREERR